MSGAGRSADDEARKAQAASDHLRRKADWAEERAEKFSRGADGERLVAEALDRLAASGWVVLHDRVHPNGGNIDHLVIGPPGVAVIDAKNWSYPVTVSGARIFTGKYSRTKALDRLTEQVRLVESLLPGGTQASVRGYLALAGEADRSRPFEELGANRIIGAERLDAHLLKCASLLTPDEVIRVAGTVVERLPSTLSLLPPPPDPASAAAPSTAVDGGPGLDEPKPIFDRFHRFFYLRTWRKAGHYRMYLSDDTGRSLGWRDCNSGELKIECDGEDERFARSLLASADPTGIKLAPRDLPKVAARVPGGKLLSMVGGWDLSVLVGQEWRGRGKHYLYGTLIDRDTATFHLGHVDLANGSIHPAIKGEISKDRGAADRYLGFLYQRWPRGN